MLKKARSLETMLVQWRREFHQHPELGFHETWTSNRIAEILDELGCIVRTGVGRTGVIGDLGKGLPIIAIRADMDALPILEANDRPYVSCRPGIMHACGHDSHIAMALGAAALLSKEHFPGRARFLFQPSEEVADNEGISGAPRMIADGAMQDVSMIIATHIDPTTSVGKVRIAAGSFSAGVDSFFAKIKGKGSHGAWPHAGIDPIHLAGHVILALNGIVSRRLDPFTPAVVSLGSIHGGQAENVIPDQVNLAGTIRFLDGEVQSQIHTEIEKALEIARTLGGDYELDIQIGTPPMVNATQVVNLIEGVVSDLLGAENCLPPVNSLGAEDFGCFSEITPGAMFTLGCKIEGDERLIHNPNFDIDESCLPLGTAIFAETALRFLAVD